MSKHLEIIIPCYNEEKNVGLVFEEIVSSLEKETAEDALTFSVIYVNDGSSDNTLDEIMKLEKQYGEKQVKYVSFSRNFGKEPALLAGLRAADGDYVAVMDADLQHPPAILSSMYEILDEGEYDCVGTKRVSRRGESPLRSLFSKMFYKIINWIGDIELVENTTDYRMMTRQVVDAILSITERERFTKGIYSWVGFNTTYLEYENIIRSNGNTKWSMMKLMKYAIDGITAFSTVPLKMATGIGVIFSAIAIIYALFVFIRTLIYGPTTAGFPTTVILILLIGGITIILLGVIGEYLARIFGEVKERPYFIIKDTNIDLESRYENVE